MQDAGRAKRDAPDAVDHRTAGASGSHATQMRRIFAWVIVAYIAITSGFLLHEGPITSKTLAAIGLLGVMAVTTYVSYRWDGRSPVLDPIDISIIVFAGYVFTKTSSLEFLLVVMTANVAVYRRGAVRYLTIVVFCLGLILLYGITDGGSRSPLELAALMPPLAAAGVLAGLISDVVRRADLVIGEERIVALADVDLDVARDADEVAGAVARAVHAMALQAGSPRRLSVNVLVGDEHQQRLAGAVADEEVELGRLVDLDSMRESPSGAGLMSVLSRGGKIATVLDGGEIEQASVDAGFLPRGIEGSAIVPLMVRGCLRGIVVVSGDELNSESLTRGLDAVCSEAARTLEGLELASDLERRRQFLTKILSESSDVITILDTDLRITFQSSGVRQLGWEPEEVVGRHAAHLVSPEDRMLAGAALEKVRVRAGDHVKFEWKARTRRGEERYIETVANNMLNDPDVAGILLNSRDITERKILEGQLEHQALHDPLTGLPNRALFNDRLAHAIARETRAGRTAALLYLDLDNFKHINDVHGHDVGDRVLGTVADRIRSVLRSVDTAARLGGDEFAVLLEGAGEDDASIVAQRLLDAVASASLELPGISGSIGVAVFEEGWSARGLIEAADAAMYAAKRAGKANWCIYHHRLAKPSERSSLLADLRVAIERDDLDVHYQPLVDLASGRIVSVEALVRWNHLERGFIPPLDFIPLAEESGLIVPLGLFVLDRAVADFKRWTSGAYGTALGRVSVNVSPSQLSQPGAAQRIAQVVQDAGVDAGRVTLEVTETALIEDLYGTADQLKELKELGFRLSVDDFGAGYAGLGYLRELPVDELKIDRSFTAEIDSSPLNSALVESILELSGKLALQTVAEGIEHKAQAEAMAALGCQVGQGFFFARPQSASDLDRVLGVSDETAAAF